MLQRVSASSVPPAVLTLTGALAVLLAFDVPVPGLGLYLAYLALAVGFPGVLAWRLLLAELHAGDRAPTWFEDLTLGTIFGFTLQLPVFLAGVALGLPLLHLLLPVAAVAVSLTGRGRAAWRLPTRRLHPGASWVLGASVLYGLFYLSRNSLPLRPLWLPLHRSPNIDETFHQALISDVGNRFPPEIPFLLGTRLDYHWFVHAQVAASNQVTGLTSVEMLRVVLPTLVLGLGLLGLGAVALRLTDRAVAAVIAPALLVAGGFHMFGPDFTASTFYEPYLNTRLVTSPSQPYGVMISMPAVMLVLEVLRSRTRPSLAVWSALTIALVGLSGAKATFLPVFVCGAIGVWGIHLLRTRRIDRTATILTGLLLAVFAFAQVVLFGGQSGYLDVAPFKTVEMALARSGLPLTTPYLATMTAVLLVGWLLYGAGAVGLRSRVLDPRAVWMLVAVPAGITVPFLLYRTGLSQLWFSRTVAELVVLASAWGMACALPRPLVPRVAALYGGVAALSGSAAFAVALLVSRAQDTAQATRLTLLLTLFTPLLLVLGHLAVRFAARVAGRRTPPLALLLTAILGLSLSNVLAPFYDTVTGAVIPGPRPGSAGGVPMFAPGGVEAAEYIAERSDPYDVVATNAHCAQPVPRCDNRHFWIAAYTERRVVVEGWGYTAATNAQFREGVRNAHLPVPDEERLAVNDAAFTDPSPETLRALVDGYGADWLFVSRDHPANTDGLFSLARDTGLITREFRNANYVVYRVEP